MSDEAIKKRQARAKQAVIDLLQKTGWDIIQSNNSKVCVIATRRTEIRMIRVVVDAISDDDQRAVRSFSLPGIPQCIREIWCQRENGFEINPVDF